MNFRGVKKSNKNLWPLGWSLLPSFKTYFPACLCVILLILSWSPLWANTLWTNNSNNNNNSSVTFNNASIHKNTPLNKEVEVWYYVPSSSKNIFNFFYQQLAEKLPQINLLPIELDEAKNCDFIHQRTHFITAGIKAFKAVSRCQLSTAIFAFYLTESQYYQNNFTNDNTKKKANLFFVDQPLINQLALAHQFIPRRNHVGILYSSSTRSQINYLKNNYPAKFKLSTTELNKPQNLIKSLVNLLKKSDYIIAPLDNNIFNARTAKTILLTSYRHQKPLFGNSKGFVKAGIIASCYSTPEILINQLIKKINQTPKITGEKFYPDDFEVVQNVEVADSLNLPMFDKVFLKHAIKNTLKTWGEEK